MRLLLPFALALSLLCSPAIAAAPTKAGTARSSPGNLTRGAPLPKWVEALEQPPPSRSDDPLVYRLAEVQYWTGPTPAYLVNRAVQVNSTSRLGEIGQVSIDFIPAYQKVLLHRIAIVRGAAIQDRTATAGVRVIDKETSPNNDMYLGESSVRILLEDVKPGDTLWLTYTVEGRNPVFDGTWTEMLPWSKPEPIVRRKAVIVSPSQRPVRWRWSGSGRADLPSPTIDSRAGLTRMRFDESDLEAADVDASLPPNLVPLPVLDLSEYKDWSQIAQWAQALFATPGTQPGVQALARQFKGASQEARASQALQWVQDEVRYFSVSLGENSHRPQAPDVVLRRRFGDCKDKTQLLVAIYRLMGLEAQPVLVNAAVPTLPAQFLPSPGTFNHAIVRVVLDGKQYFVDPTLQHQRAPIGKLPPPVPGASALVIERGTNALVTLPQEALDEALVERSEQMHIDTVHGDGVLRIRSEYRGRMAASMRGAFRSLGAADVRKYLLGEVERTYPGIAMSGAPLASDTEDGTGFIVEAQFSVPAPLKEVDGMLTLQMRSHILDGALELPDKLVRKQPLWLAAGRYRARYKLEVTLPAQARLVRQDDQFSLEDAHIDARAQLTWRGAQLNYYIDFAVTDPEIAPGELQGFEQRARKLNPLFENTFRFQPSGLPREVSGEASLRVLDIVNKITAFQDLQEEAISTGKIPEIRLDRQDYEKLSADGLCEAQLRSYAARAWNPLASVPVAAIGKLLAAKADKAGLESCEARRLFIGHDLRGASQALRTYTPADGEALALMQAWTAFHTGDTALARTHLARFLKARQQAGSLNAYDAELGFALARRLGIAEPPEIQFLVTHLRSDAWPMPVFRLLRGELPPEGLLQAVAALPPASREHADLEARFAIAQFLLATHEPRKSDPYVNRLARLGLLGSDYEVLASADQLGGALADPDASEALRLEAESGKERAAIEHWSRAASRGVALAQSNLGSRYLRGKGVKADIPRALQLLQGAADKGVSDALNELGSAYADPIGVPRDDARAIAYYERAVELADPAAGFNLGRTFWHGEHGHATDYRQAFALFRPSAESGDVGSAFFLSRHYFDAKGTRKNDALARFWAAQGAFHGDDDSIAQLGNILLRTAIDKERRQLGLHMLQMTAARRNSFACVEYAHVLLDGIGIEAEPKAAYVQLMLAGPDNKRALALLGRMYAEGRGVARNTAKGLALLAKLEAEQQLDGLYELGQVYRSEASEVTDKVKAAAYFRQAAGRGHLDAAEALAVMLHTGEGIPVNLAEAARYYEMAIEAGKPRALNNLAVMYEEGTGVAKNPGHARELYRRAARLGHMPAMLSMGEVYEADAGTANAGFAALAYFMLADRLGLHDAREGIVRMKQRVDAATIARATKFVTEWKPGMALPEES
jgi:TPR repeat protein/transglutaminase-like putative cysteine protease